MARRTVKWSSSEKGFGFITQYGDGSDIFFYHCAIVGLGHRSLEEGQQVGFETTHRAERAASDGGRTCLGTASPLPTSSARAKLGRAPVRPTRSAAYKFVTLRPDKTS
jgi:cold shock protein